MDDLPELPFEKVLSYLSLEELIKARAVSRRWYHVISSFRVKRLCYSAYPREFIGGKSRPISRELAPSLIISPRFASFFNTFGRSILFNLKHLHLRDLRLEEKNRADFTRTVNTFGQLEKLSIINAGSSANFIPGIELELSLPVLTSIQLEDLRGIQLTLDTPKLANVKFWNCGFPKLELVHPESVERLVAYSLERITKRLINLKRFYGHEIDLTLLSDLKQLKEIHLCDRSDILELFEEKRRLGRVDLKIYIDGLLLSGLDDPAIDSSYRRSNEFFVHLAENPSRLADEIPFKDSLRYEGVERVAPELAINILSRFTGLRKILTCRLIQDVQRFLDLLKNFDNIVDLAFLDEPQQQDLLDGLPEHCALQSLIIACAPSDFQFLFGLKQHLTLLVMHFSIDIELIRRVLDELQLLTLFNFSCDGNEFRVETVPLRKFHVSLNYSNGETCSDSNDVVEYILRFTQKEGE